MASWEGIVYDGFFVVVLDLKRKTTTRLIDTVDVNAFYRQHANFAHVMDAVYEYRFYKIYPNGVQFLNKFRSHYSGIDFRF